MKITIRKGKKAIGDELYLGDMKEVAFSRIRKITRGLNANVYICI